MKRIFAAIKLHPSDNFLQVYNDLKTSCKFDKINWVVPENIHITLKFFGETEEDKIEDINSILSDMSFRHSPFTLKLSDVGIFGSSYKPRVIWFGINKNQKLQNLAVGVMAPGEFEFGTTTIEYMTVISGELTVLLPNETTWKSYKPYETFIVEKDSKFKVRVNTQTSYKCLYK